MFTELFDGFSEKRSEGGFRIFEGVDVQINKFVEANPFYQIVDVKLTVQPDGNIIALVIFE